MALPFTTYAPLVAGAGLLSRVKALDAVQAQAAETWAMRETQAWLLRALEGSPLRFLAQDEGEDWASTYGSPELHQRFLLDDIEAFWDGRAVAPDNGVDPLIQDVARTAGEMRYLQTLGFFDGKTGSSQFWLRRYCRSETEEARLRVYAAGKLNLDGTGLRYFRVRRFHEL